MRAGETNYSTWEAYALSDKAYMVFEFIKTKPHWIYSIQITGDKTDMLPFVGLKLGDSKDKVIRMLGEPDDVSKKKNKNIYLFTYRSKNFTLQINDKGKLYSIRIYGYNRLFESATSDSDFSCWDDFKKTVSNKDFSGLSDFFRPDVEIYKNDEILEINESFHTFFLKPSGKFYEALFSESNSVYKELQACEPKAEIRLVADFGVGHVFKFYEGKILEEIVFFPYAGRHRIYEIKFRSQLDKFAQQEDVSEIQEICRYLNLSKKMKIPIHSCVEGAKQGDAIIQTYIGIYYLKKSDFKNAKEWFEKGAIQGEPNAQNGLGYLYQFGYGVEKDRKKANALFLKSAKQGNPDSQYWLGENLFLDGQQKEGFKWSRKAAENGSRDAQYNIAIMYKKGQGVEEDQVQSYLWFSIAARNGHNNAQEYINDFNSKLPKDVLDEMTTYVENSIKMNPKYINK